MQTLGSNSKDKIEKMTETATGKVVQVLGNVVDVEFTLATLPNINDALRVGINTGAGSGQAAGDGAATVQGEISAEPRGPRAS